MCEHASTTISLAYLWVYTIFAKNEKNEIVNIVEKMHEYYYSSSKKKAIRWWKLEMQSAKSQTGQRTLRRVDVVRYGKRT